MGLKQFMVGCGMIFTEFGTSYSKDTVYPCSTSGEIRNWRGSEYFRHCKRIFLCISKMRILEAFVNRNKKSSLAHFGNIAHSRGRTKHWQNKYSIVGKESPECAMYYICMSLHRHLKCLYKCHQVVGVLLVFVGQITSTVFDGLQWSISSVNVPNKLFLWLDLQPICPSLFSGSAQSQKLS